ncbi:unnamed protein product, partial [Mesorhabditis spiculigera]
MMWVLWLLLFFLCALLFCMCAVSAGVSLYRCYIERRRIANVRAEIEAFDALVETALTMDPFVPIGDLQKQVLKANCTCTWGVLKNLC